MWVRLPSQPSEVGQLQLVRIAPSDYVIFQCLGRGYRCKVNVSRLLQSFCRDYRLKGWRFSQFETVHVIILSCAYKVLYMPSLQPQTMRASAYLERSALGKRNLVCFGSFQTSADRKTTTVACRWEVSISRSLISSVKQQRQLHLATNFRYKKLFDNRLNNLI